MKVVHQKLNLDQPATYQIKVPGRLDENLSDWVEGMTITVEREDNGSPITTLTGDLVDQAALQGLLRLLYTLGLPLIEVKWIGPESNKLLKFGGLPK
jgi:hypothetical protein